MQMERRSFLRAVVGAGALLAGPALWLFERLAPARYVEAVRIRSRRFYPGPVQELDEREISKPGKWAG